MRQKLIIYITAEVMNCLTIGRDDNGSVPINLQWIASLLPWVRVITPCETYSIKICFLKFKTRGIDWVQWASYSTKVIMLKYTNSKGAL